MSVLIKGMDKETAVRICAYAGVRMDDSDFVSVPPHEIFGTWEWDPDGIDWDIGAWKCSNCGSKAETWWATDEKEVPLRCAGSHYCGNCGATMRK